MSWLIVKAQGFKNPDVFKTQENQRFSTRKNIDDSVFIFEMRAVYNFIADKILASFKIYFIRLFASLRVKQFTKKCHTYTKKCNRLLF